MKNMVSISRQLTANLLAVCMFDWKRDAAEYSQSHEHVEVLKGRRVQSLDAQAKTILLDGEPCHPGPSRYIPLNRVLASACAGYADRCIRYLLPLCLRPTDTVPPSPVIYSPRLTPAPMAMQRRWVPRVV